MSTNSNRPTRGASSARIAAHFAPAGAFWDEVECEIEALDVNDFEAFLAADELPIDPDPSFRERLSGHLKQLVRTRFAH